MFAVTARFPDGRVHLIGFANSEAEVNEMVNMVVAKYGQAKLEEMGVSFYAELAM